MSKLELDNRRDRENMYPEVMTFFGLTAWFIMEMGYILPGMTQFTQDRLVLVLLFGAAICVLASSLGSKVILPNVRPSTCYYMQVVGLVLIIFSLTWMNMVTPAEAPNIGVWLQNGGPTILLEIGCVRALVDFIVGIVKDKEELADED